MSNLTRFERAGVAAGMATGILGCVLAGMSLGQSAQTQKRADEAQKAAQAQLVVAYSALMKGGVTTKVQNFSPLPITHVFLFGRDYASVLNEGLPGCHEFEITRFVEDSNSIGIGGSSPIAIEFTDAAGTRWHRVADAEPELGRVDEEDLAQIKGDARLGSGAGDDAFVATPIKGCE